MKKWFTFYVLLLLTCFSLSAQSVEKSVISAIGNSYSGQKFSVSYNIGELVIGSQESEDGSIQLGSWYYTSLNLITLDIDIPELKFGGVILSKELIVGIAVVFYGLILYFLFKPKKWEN